VASHAGASYNRPFRMNMTALGHMAQGKTPTIETLKSIDESEWPELIKARRTVPNANSRTQRIADIGFRKMINPFVNTVIRTPVFQAEMFKHMKQMQPLIDEGVLSEDEALTKALHISTTNMTRFIHNLHDRTQLSETMRNWSPFYFAQEQAYRRMGRLLAEDPGAFRRYQMMIAQVGHMANNATNPQGQGYYTFPAGTWLARGITDAFGRLGLPLVNVDAGGFDVSLSSANVIFPLSSGFRPGASPIAALSAKALQGLFPETTPALETALGKPTMESGLISQMIPNTTVQRLLIAVHGEMGTPGRAFASSMMQAMQLAMYDQNVAYERWVRNGSKGKPPQIVPSQMDASDPQVMQKFINRIKNQTFILYATNAILGFFSPVSPHVKVKDFGFPKELQADISGYNSVAKGMTAFLLRHPDATPYTVFQSQTTTGGTIPESQQGEDWLNSHVDLQSKYPNILPYVMPNVSNVYSQSVYDEQLAQGLRIKRDPMSVSGPQSFLNQLYIAAGNQVYYQAVAQHEANLDQIGNASAGKSREYSDWQQYLAQLQTQAPIWAAYGPLSNFKASNMREQISQLRAMVASGEVPDNPNANALAQILGYFNEYNARYAAASASFNYQRNETRINDEWKGYLDQVIAARPNLSPAIRAIFYDALGQGRVPLNG
jgi:hypothetical protein